MQELRETEYESLICGMFGVDRSGLVNMGHRRRCGRVTECLHLCVYFLHYRAGFSITHIAGRYGMTARNVSYIASKMRYGAVSQAYYREMVDRVESALSEMREAAADDTDTAS